MQVVTDLGRLGPARRSVAIGTFDGVHAGHRAVMRRGDRAGARARAAQRRGDVRPSSAGVIDPARVPRLLTPQPGEGAPHRRAGPGRARPAAVRRAPGAHDAPGLSAASCSPARCGRASSSSARTSTSAPAAPATRRSCAVCGEAYGYETVVVPLVTEHGKTISSTRIRRLLQCRPARRGARDPRAAAVGRRPRRAAATSAAARSACPRPTSTSRPARSSRAGASTRRACTSAERWYRAAVNVGHNPTFRSKDAETTHVTVEAFLLRLRAGTSTTTRSASTSSTGSATSAASTSVESSSRRCSATSPTRPTLEDAAFAEVGLAAGSARLNASARARFRRRHPTCATLARPSTRLRVANPLLGSRILLRGR